MYEKSYMESDGELFKMRQEAIRRAQEMSRAASLPMPDRGESCPEEEETKPFLPAPSEAQCGALAAHKDCPPAKKGSLLGGLFGGRGKGFLGGLFSNLKLDDILLLVLLFLLVTEKADTDIILIIGFLLIAGFLGD